MRSDGFIEPKVELDENLWKISPHLPVILTVMERRDIIKPGMYVAVSYLGMLAGLVCWIMGRPFLGLMIALGGLLPLFLSSLAYSIRRQRGPAHDHVREAHDTPTAENVTRLVEAYRSIGEARNDTHSLSLSVRWGARLCQIAAEDWKSSRHLGRSAALLAATGARKREGEAHFESVRLWRLSLDALNHSKSILEMRGLQGTSDYREAERLLGEVEAMPGFATVIGPDTSPERDFDLFLSYKSENAETVRALADRLLAGSVRVWFAEYEVLATRRYRFQEMVDRGIDRSRHALLFTNDLYAGSDYCGLEVRRILDKPRPGKVLEVRIPDQPKTREVYKGLNGIPFWVFDGRIEGILDFLEKHTGLRVTGATASPIPAAGARLAAGRGVVFDAYGFRPEGGVEAVPSSHGLAGLFEGRWGDRVLKLGVFVSPTKTSFPSIQSLYLDDRALFNTYLFHTQSFVDPLGGELLGVHLFFNKSAGKGASHIGVTYSMPDRDLPGRWERRYVLPLKKTVGRQGEVHFVFGIKLPVGIDRESARREICALAPWTDKIVASAELNLTD